MVGEVVGIGIWSGLKGEPELLSERLPLLLVLHPDHFLRLLLLLWVVAS